ncbi:MAG: hypothetical protein HY748_09565 [Elusimicrobia bacterium]|nr:hypothetical protein [Elusimicrobiota bacterium]
MRTFRSVVVAALLLACIPAAQAADGAASGFESLVTQAWESLRTGLTDFKTWAAGPGAAGGKDEMYPPRTTLMKVGKCWTRAEDPRAEELALPKEFCVDIVGVEVHFPYYHPFTTGSVMLMEGKPVSGRFHISGGAREESGWSIVGDLFTGRKQELRCGELNYAGAAIYVGTDIEGRLREQAPVSVRGFMFDAASLCRTPAKSVEVPYTRRP